MPRREVTGKKPRATAVPAWRSGPPQRSKPKIKTAVSETMTVSETTSSKPEIEAAPPTESRVNDKAARPPIRGPPTAVFSIKSFCIAHGISEDFYFELRKQGRGPREMRLGTRVFITLESAACWRVEREAATVAAE
jgi:hypothetical protein